MEGYSVDYILHLRIQLKQKRKIIQMPNNYIFKQSIPTEAASFIKNKVIPFFKQGLLVPFIFATILYILMRVFFIGAEFDMRESVELYLKTVLVTWSYITLWRVICLGIIWLEVKTTKVKFSKVISMPVLKKTAIVILTCGLTYAVKAKSFNRTEQKNIPVENTSEASDTGFEPKFHVWMK